MLSRYKSFQYIEQLPKLVGEKVTLRGWVVNKTEKGKLIFIILRDGTGIAQLVFSKNNIEQETFESAKLLAQESSIEITGSVRADDRAPGSYEIDVENLKIYQIAKDYPITPKEHGDAFLMEHRHLWLRSSRQHAIMRVRASVIRAIHEYLDGQGFLQMDSPILTPNAAEGTSTLFETQYFDLGKAYLSQSGQLYAEATAMAMGKVYTFGPTFRAELSKTRRHLTEFWMIEPEMAFFDLNDDMDLAEDLVEYIVKYVLKNNRKELETLERDITQLEKVQRPFYRLSYDEAVDYLQKNNIPLKKKINGEDVDILPFPWGEDFGSPQEEAIMEQFDKPCIIHRYPTDIKAFYMKRDPENPKVVLAMDMLAPEKGGEIIGGSQREENIEFLEERIKNENLPLEAYQWYLDLRRFGSVPHSGFGLGLERTVKWITGASHIREVIPFPRMIYRIYP
ncbi:MAG TPA: asparagine--tRNA ligase [Candidatus Kapabacteria bacterium]|nr:asparagine--tRNA ligase [Candidatus Kapabacteria bacterium]